MNESSLSAVSKMLKLDDLDHNPNLSVLEDQLGVKPSYIALALGIFLFITGLIANAATVGSFVVGFIIPAYFSLLSMPRGSMQKYIVYWIIFVMM